MSKIRWEVILLMLALINIFLFWPGSLYFLNDDFIHIPLTDQNEIFQTNAIRPVHELLVKLDLVLWGKNAWGFHLTALLLHAVVIFQLYKLSKILQQKYNPSSSVHPRMFGVLAVAIFLIYPQHSESLAWILGRTPTLAAIFLLATLQLYFKTDLAVRHIALASICFLISLFTYEQVALMPLLLILFARLERTQQLHRKQFFFSFSLFASLILYIICRVLVTDEVVGSYEGGNIISLQWKTLLFNLVKLIVRLWVNPAENNYILAIGVAAFLIIFALLIYYSWGRLRLAYKLFFFLLAAVVLLIAPMISLGITVRSFESGRYLYLPSIFFALMMALMLSETFLKAKKLLLIIALALVLYWMSGKIDASNDYKIASTYSRVKTTEVVEHFKSFKTNFHIDTLKTEIHRLPVFRLGFKEGVVWLDKSVDTAKIIVRYYDTGTQKLYRK